MQVAGGLDDRGAGIAHAAAGRDPQSHGDPRAGRYLWDLLGERPARTVGLPAPPAALVPAELQPALAVRQIAGPSRRGALHPRGEHPALGAGPRLLIGGDQVHPAGTVLQPLHPRDGQAVQVEQQRRIVVQARGF